MSGNLQWLLKQVEKAMEEDKEFHIVAECKECQILDIFHDMDHEIYLYQEQPFKTKQDDKDHKQALWDMIAHIERLKS